MLDAENLPKLERAQERLASIKVEKARARYEKYKDKELSLSGALEHLQSEYAELMAAIPGLDTERIMGELADLSNMVDIFATLVLEYRDA